MREFTYCPDCMMSWLADGGDCQCICEVVE